MIRHMKAQRSWGTLATGLRRKKMTADPPKRKSHIYGGAAIDLFHEIHEANARKAQPLAARMRPRSLDEFVGQEHFLGPGKRSTGHRLGPPQKSSKPEPARDGSPFREVPANPAF